MKQNDSSVFNKKFMLLNNSTNLDLIKIIFSCFNKTIVTSVKKYKNNN